MIFHDIAQGSGEWEQARIGIPTASEFDRVVTPLGKLSKSKTTKSFMHALIAEKLLNRPLKSLEGLEWAERGKELEAEAARFYVGITGTEVLHGGFFTTDDGEAGASPDRRIGNDGLLEIKCPAPNTQIGYMDDGFDREYFPQLQGQLFVTERRWVDWFAYSPEMPPVLIRVYRDEDYITLLREALQVFVTEKQAMEERIRAKGFFATREKLVNAREALQDPHYYEALHGG